MGKSGKKVKSDKINALRKQYDAFLEEDKKRKDRNDFILGRLENMRFSNTVPVPIHHQKTHSIRDYYTFPQRPYIAMTECCVDHKHAKGEQNNSLSTYNTYNRQLDENSILQEISKKYILIPKLQSTTESDKILTDSRTKTITDIDWKNKYNILDELKRNEKEATHDNDNKITEMNKNMLRTDITLTTSNNENTLPESNWKPEYERQQNSCDQSVQKNNLNISIDINDITQNNTEYLKNPIEKINDSALNFESDKNYTKLNKETCDIKGNRNEDNLIDNTMIQFTTDEQEETAETKESKDYLQEKDQHNNLANERKEVVKEAQVSDNHGHDNYNTYKYTNSTENNKNELMKGEGGEGEGVNQNLNNIDTSIMKLTAEGDKHESKDRNETVLSNTEEYKTEEEHFDSPELSNVETGKDAHEHEVYTNSNENYDNNQVENEPVTYAIENDDYMNENSQINNESKAYPPENENYTNQEYTYYDESHQEPYSNQINEHEESSERYDPNYEQQYANNYDDANVAQYQKQQYEVENTYAQQDINNTVFESQNEGDVNFEYGNPESVVDQPQHENIYNYENDVNVNDDQQYDSNVQQEYSVIQNDQYGHQQEYNESEIIENVEKQLDADNALTENITEHINEDTSENVQSDVTIS